MQAATYCPPDCSPVPQRTLHRIVNMRALFLLLLALIAFTPAPARAAQSYDTCTGFITTVPATIAAPGTYCVKQDLVTSMTNGDAIAINASNVTLDCNDFRIDDLGAGAATSAIGIHATNQSYVTVRHCNVRGFLYGIELADNGSGKGANIIEDNHLDGNTNVGIASSATRSIIRRNTVLDTGGTSGGFGVAGIQVSGNSAVDDNVVSGVTSKAGSADTASGIQYSNNPSQPDGTVNRNRVSNVASSPAGTSYGIYLGGPMTIARDNIIFGIAVGSSRALECSPGFNVLVRGTLAAGAGINNLDACADAGGNNFSP